MADKLTQAAHILIDAVVSFAPEQKSGPDSPMNIAVRRLNDVPNLVSVDYARRRVDVSPIVNGSIVSMYILTAWCAEARGVSQEEVLADLREQLDALP